MRLESLSACITYHISVFPKELCRFAASSSLGCNCIDKSSFEVGEEVASRFSPDHKRWDARKKKFFVDLKKANEHQLRTFGLPEEQIEISPYSTVLHNQDYFSYRKEKGKTGRMLAIIGLRGTDVLP